MPKVLFQMFMDWQGVRSQLPVLVDGENMVVNSLLLFLSKTVSETNKKLGNGITVPWWYYIWKMNTLKVQPWQQAEREEDVKEPTFHYINLSLLSPRTAVKSVM